jgi:hypothetical protein
MVKHVCTVKGAEPEVLDGPTPTERTLPDGQKADHWVLCEDERSSGYVRPVRREYRHQACGQKTTMPIACAETYAKQPSFYGSTFCCACGGYFPVGEDGQFVWLDDGTKVGT